MGNGRLDYYGLMINRIAWGLAAAGLFAAGAMAQSPRVPEAAPAAASASALDGELFYQLLLGEIAVRSGESGAGYSLLLEAARKTADPRLYRRAVEVALQNRAGNAALEAAQAWKAALPQSRDANRFLLQILVSLGRLRESIEPLRAEVAATPAAERASVIEVMPRIFSRAPDKRAAAEVVEEALADHLKSEATAAAAWTTVGRLRVQAGDPAAAIEAARRAQQASPAAAGPAWIALELMDPKVPLAEPIVQRYLQQSGAMAEVRLGYARNLLDAQRYAEAAAQLEQIVKQSPETADAWLLRGVLQLQENTLDAAESSLKRYIELTDRARTGSGDERRRGRAQAYLSLSRIAERRGKLSDANAWLDKIENAEEMVAAQNRRASILARQGRMADARKIIQELPERNPADRRMKLLAEVQLLKEHKLLREAHDVLAAAVKVEPNDAELLYEQAMLAEKIGRVDDMEALLRRLIALKPDYHHAYNALGYSLADRNVRLPEARDLIVKALSFAPEDPFITDSLAWVEFRMGNHTEALRLLEKAYKARPDAEIAAHLGEVLWVMGQRDRAVSIWREGLQINPDNDTLVETIRRFQVRL